MFYSHMRLWILSSAKVNLDEWWVMRCLNLTSCTCLQLQTVIRKKNHWLFWTQDLANFWNFEEASEWFQKHPILAETWLGWVVYFGKFYPLVLIVNIFPCCIFLLPRIQKRTSRLASRIDYMEMGQNLNVSRLVKVFKSLVMDPAPPFQFQANRSSRCSLCNFHAARPQRLWRTESCAMAASSPDRETCFCCSMIVLFWLPGNLAK